MKLGDGYAPVFSHFSVETLPPASVSVDGVHGDFQELFCVHFESPSDFFRDLDAISLLQLGLEPDFL